MTESFRRPRPPVPLALEWDVDAVVRDLRNLRSASLMARQRVGLPSKLPSRRVLLEVVHALRQALFPNRLSSRELADESVDYFVGHTLDGTLRELAQQILRELEFGEEPGGSPREYQDRAVTLVQAFARELPSIRQRLETDIQATFQGDPAAQSMDEVLACYPGITAMTHYRVAHVLCRLGARLVARIITELAHSTTGIDIHPEAQIGNSLFIDHGTGVVVGQTAILGERVRIHHGVTLGAKSVPTDDRGTILRGAPRHPIVEDDVIIYSGATILGRVTIGRGSVIGGNVWVTTDVPPGSYITQAKLRFEEFDGGCGI